MSELDTPPNSPGTSQLVSLPGGTLAGTSGQAWTNPNSIGAFLYAYNGSTWDLLRSFGGALNVNIGGAATVSIAAGTVANTVVKGSAGRLCGVLIWQTGSAAVVIYDNNSTASGTVIGMIAASAPAGTFMQFTMPAVNGIVVQGIASLPGVTVSFI